MIGALSESLVGIGGVIIVDCKVESFDAVDVLGFDAKPLYDRGVSLTVVVEARARLPTRICIGTKLLVVVADGDGLATRMCIGIKEGVGGGDGLATRMCIGTYSVIFASAHLSANCATVRCRETPCEGFEWSLKRQELVAPSFAVCEKIKGEAAQSL